MEVYGSPHVQGCLSGLSAQPDMVMRTVMTDLSWKSRTWLSGLPPKMPYWGSDVVFELRVFDMQNTVAVNYAGNPALAIPIAMPPQGKTTPVTSLQLVGPRLSEAALLNAGRLIERTN